MLPKKVLLAEDDADDRDFFCQFVNGQKEISLMAMVENGEEVFDLLQNIPHPNNLPDLILLDQNMPKRNGLQTVSMLKEDSRYRNIPVFIYSTYADEVLLERSREAGAVSVFSKPDSNDGYVEMMEAMLLLTQQKRK